MKSQGGGSDDFLLAAELSRKRQRSTIGPTERNHVSHCHKSITVTVVKGNAEIKSLPK